MGARALLIEHQPHGEQAATQPGSRDDAAVTARDVKGGALGPHEQEDQHRRRHEQEGGLDK
jgi:hypothetical protein